MPRGAATTGMPSQCIANPTNLHHRFARLSAMKRQQGSKPGRKSQITSAFHRHAGAKTAFASSPNELQKMPNKLTRARRHARSGSFGKSPHPLQLCHHPILEFPAPTEVLGGCGFTFGCSRPRRHSPVPFAPSARLQPKSAAWMARSGPGITQPGIIACVVRRDATLSLTWA
jgi:hypothetical protein